MHLKIMDEHLRDLRSILKKFLFLAKLLVEFKTLETSFTFVTFGNNQLQMTNDLISNLAIKIKIHSLCRHMFLLYTPSVLTTAATADHAACCFSCSSRDGSCEMEKFLLFIQPFLEI